ncbi:MAG TPA: LamG-like jellyroll fold domain-containing protein, partial [Anaerolineae bacterium]|nr:LamG-like jellyroll fold domain-containing protein [Anaerolineae bacterium]
GTTVVVTATWAANSAIIYINGLKDADEDTTVTVPAGLGDIQFGHYNAGSQLGGSVQRLNIWNRALSAGEVEYVYNRDYRGRWRVA